MTKMELNNIQIGLDNLKSDLDKSLENIFAKNNINLTQRRKEDIKMLLDNINSDIVSEVLDAYKESTLKVENYAEEIKKKSDHLDTLIKSEELKLKETQTYEETLYTKLKDELGADPKLVNAFVLAKNISAVVAGKKDNEIKMVEHIVCTYLNEQYKGDD